MGGPWGGGSRAFGSGPRRYEQTLLCDLDPRVPTTPRCSGAPVRHSNQPPGCRPPRSDHSWDPSSSGVTEDPRPDYDVATGPPGSTGMPEFLFTHGLGSRGTSRVNVSSAALVAVPEVGVGHVRKQVSRGTIRTISRCTHVCARATHSFHRLSHSTPPLRWQGCRSE